MVARSGVAAYADVPIADAARAGTGASLVRSSSLAEGIEQGHHILLVLRAQRADADVERAVLPEQIVLQHRVRDLGAGPVGSASAGFVMAIRAGDCARRERGRQLWTVYHGYNACRLRQRGRAVGRNRRRRRLAAG